MNVQNCHSEIMSQNESKIIKQKSVEEKAIQIIEQNICKSSISLDWLKEKIAYLYKGNINARWLASLMNGPQIKKIGIEKFN